MLSKKLSNYWLKKNSKAARQFLYLIRRLNIYKTIQHYVFSPMIVEVMIDNNSIMSEEVMLTS